MAAAVMVFASRALLPRLAAGPAAVVAVGALALAAVIAAAKGMTGLAAATRAAVMTFAATVSAGGTAAAVVARTALLVRAALRHVVRPDLLTVVLAARAALLAATSVSAVRTLAVTLTATLAARTG